MCRINNSYGHTAWMMGIRALDKLAGKTEADKYHLLCGRCAALPMGLWNQSVSLFLPHHSKLKCLSSSLCALLSLSLSLPLSLTLSQCPISAVNSHQGCQGCWVKHWTELTGGEGGGGNREELCQSDESRERRQLNLMVAGSSCAAEEM